MTLHFDGEAIEPLPGETALEAIERQGLSIPSFCRSGVCQACLLQAKRGDIPAAAQQGLRMSQRRERLLMACMCRPEGDLELERPGGSEARPTRVEHVERISDAVLRVMIACPEGLEYEAGQFIQLERPTDGLMRPYSVASLPGCGYLELHVALLPGGEMSGWLRSAAGQAVNVRGPFGECRYMPEEPERPLLLAGTGTGLAPLLGVVRAALRANHRAPIRLYHGSTSPSGLYLWGELCALAAEAFTLTLIGSVLSGDCSGDQGPRCELRNVPLDQAISVDGIALPEQRVFLCGHPDLVKKLQRKIYLAGAPLERIHADPFVTPTSRSAA